MLKGMLTDMKAREKQYIAREVEVDRREKESRDRIKHNHKLIA